MSFVSEIKWDKQPIDLEQNVSVYGETLQSVLMAMLEHYAEQIQSDMRLYAPWTDRTGEARAQLEAFVEVVGDQIILVALQGVSYGIYLELKNAGRFAIVGPTLERYQGLIMQDVHHLMGNH